MLVKLSDLIKLFSREGRKFYFFIARTAGYCPHSTDHFRKAFIHRSAGSSSAKGEDEPDNERLEFLGDAVIETVVSDVLYHHFPQAAEGVMSQLRSNMVCRARLNEVSFQLGLDEYIVLSSRKDLAISHIPGDVLEAFVAAVYLDGGMSKAKKFVVKHIASEARIDEALHDTQQTNFKSELLSLGEQNGVEIFFETHKVTDKQKETDGADVNFVSEAKLFDVVVGRGVGRSKKQAEQAAAEIAVNGIHNGSISLQREPVAVAENIPQDIPEIKEPEVDLAQSLAEKALPSTEV